MRIGGGNRLIGIAKLGTTLTLTNEEQVKSKKLQEFAQVHINMRTKHEEQKEVAISPWVILIPGIVWKNSCNQSKKGL
jgi:hypothetical protein